MTSRTTLALTSKVVSRGASTTKMGAKSRGASTTNVGLKSAMASRSRLAVKRRPPKKKGIFGALRYQMEDFFTRGVVLYLSALTCAILIFSILWIGFLYHQKLARANVQSEAIDSMLDYAVTLEPYLKERNDTEKMMHLQKLADILAVWTLKTMELEDAIDDLERKLYLDWMLHKEVLYFFGEVVNTWDGARSFCERERSLLVYVESDAEERFLEKTTKSAHQDSWIGFFYDKNWEWVNGQNYPGSFWRQYSPVKDAGDCAILLANCIPERCWHNVLCSEKKRPICKMEPEKKWFD